MRTIWKFPIRVVDQQQVAIPAGASVLCVQVQNGQPCLWATVETDAPVEQRSVLTFGTGHPIADPVQGSYAGTYQIHSGDLVFHVFIV